MSSIETQLLDQADAAALERLIRQMVHAELQRLEDEHSSATPVFRETSRSAYRVNTEIDRPFWVGGGNPEMKRYEDVRSQALVLGRWIVADPAICHGKPTFRNTRIMVWQVLEMVASGMAWETIVEQWDGKVTKDAIAEAVQLANRSFLEHAHEHALEMVIA